MKINEDTIIDARNGIALAQEEIVSASIATIRKLALSYVTEGIDFDDLEQEGLIGLFAAVDSYKAGMGAEFSTYAYRCIVNGMLTAVKKARRKKHEPLNSAKPLSEFVKTPSTEELAVFNEQYRQLKQIIYTELSELERRVLFAVIDGIDYVEIAKRCDVSVKSVDNALYRARNKLRHRNV